MILIKNVEIPKSCAQCWFSKGVFCAIRNDDDWVGDHQANQTKPEWCPITEIVQCKDCKWYKHEEEDEVGMGWCANFKPASNEHFICWDNWYCADGERKDGSD